MATESRKQAIKDNKPRGRANLWERVKPPSFLSSFLRPHPSLEYKQALSPSREGSMTTALPTSCLPLPGLDTPPFCKTPPFQTIWWQYGHFTTPYPDQKGLLRVSDLDNENVPRRWECTRAEAGQLKTEQCCSFFMLFPHFSPNYIFWKNVKPTGNWKDSKVSLCINLT